MHEILVAVSLMDMESRQLARGFFYVLRSNTCHLMILCLQVPKNVLVWCQM